MEFENQYLTYEEFLSLSDDEIGQMPFNLLEFDVRKKIDERTQNRLKDLTTIPDDVKICVYKCIKTLQSYNSIDKNVTSESTDGYSVTYKQNIDKSIETDLENIMCSYLNNIIVNGVPVLFLGVL